MFCVYMLHGYHMTSHDITCISSNTMSYQRTLVALMNQDLVLVSSVIQDKQHTF